MMKRPVRGMVALLVLAMVAAACSGTDSTDTTTGNGQQTTTTGNGQQTTTTGNGQQTTTTAGGQSADTWHSTIVPGPVEIGVLPAAGTESLAFIEEIAAGIEEDFPGTEVTLTFDNTEVQPAMEQRRRGGDPLDSEYFIFDGTSPALREWAEVGSIADLRPYLEQVDPATGETWLSTISPGALNFMTSPDDNGIYAIPTEMTTIVLFYNAKMFADNGLEPPTTWDEFLAVSESLKTAGIDPVAVTGLIDFYIGMWTDYAFIRHVGYETARNVIANGEGTVLDDPGFLKALEMIQDLRDRDYFLDGWEGTDFTAVQAQFFQGDAAMILMGTWLVAEMKDVIPDDFELAVVPFPTVAGAGGDQDVMMGVANQMAVTADSDALLLALEYLRRMTSFEVQSRRALELGQISPIIGVPAPDGMSGIEQILGGDLVIQPRYLGLLGTDAWALYYAQVQALMLGFQDAQETLDSIAADLANLYGN